MYLLDLQVPDIFVIANLPIISVAKALPAYLLTMCIAKLDCREYTHRVARLVGDGSLVIRELTHYIQRITCQVSNSNMHINRIYRMFIKYFVIFQKISNLCNLSFARTGLAANGR